MFWGSKGFCYFYPLLTDALQIKWWDIADIIIPLNIFWKATFDVYN